jgi:hypothetical protein
MTSLKEVPAFAGMTSMGEIKEIPASAGTNSYRMTSLKEVPACAGMTSMRGHKGDSSLRWNRSAEYPLSGV